MSTGKRKKKTRELDESRINQLVISQAADDSAWEPPIHVKRPKRIPLSTPGELAAHAAFLASLHRESGIDKWIERIVRERLELKELAFTQAKKDLAS